MKKLVATLIVIAGTFPYAVANAETAVVGELDCDLSAGIGAIVGSKQDMTCTFIPSSGGAPQHYVGNITNFGIDIGNTERSKLLWLVYNAARGSASSLEGTYRGVAADASLGLGVGAKVLAGGDRNSISLQPASVQADVGLNVAVGVESLNLRFVR